MEAFEAAWRKPCAASVSQPLNREAEHQLVARRSRRVPAGCQIDRVCRTGQHTAATDYSSAGHSPHGSRRSGATLKPLGPKRMWQFRITPIQSAADDSSGTARVDSRHNLNARPMDGKHKKLQGTSPHASIRNRTFRTGRRTRQDHSHLQHRMQPKRPRRRRPQRPSTGALRSAQTPYNSTASAMRSVRSARSAAGLSTTT